jgi:hypothetical protein
MNATPDDSARELISGVARFDFFPLPPTLASFCSFISGFLVGISEIGRHRLSRFPQ